jgi:proteic killer suppression protein
LILKIKHTKLRKFWETGQAKGLNAAWIDKIRRILFALEYAAIPSDMDFPGFRLHSLIGEKNEFYAVSVTKNWRIIFRFEDGNTTDIDMIDYH